MMVFPLFRKLAEAPGFGPLRAHLARERAQSDAAGTVMMADRLGLAVLDTDFLAQFRAKSSTLVVLGSGESVEEVTPSQWELIGGCVSVGLNNWLVHDFIPDIYSLVQMQISADKGARVSMSELLRREAVVKSAPAVLLLRPHSATSSDRVIDIPAGLRERTRVYGRIGVATKNRRNLVRDLRRLIRYSLKGQLPESVAIDEGMSVARMLSLGVRAGFSSIVLVGVDLISTEYFFDINPSYLTRRGLADYNPLKPSGSVHGTEETETRTFAASTFIPAFAEAARQEVGTRVYVSSPSSALANHLPVFDFRDLVSS
jgi:hypothetical protein